MAAMRFKSVLLVGSLAGLSACGGSGSSVTISQYPVDLAISDFSQMAHSFHLTGSADGSNYTLDLSITPGSQASFGGVQAMTFKTTATETKDGTTSASNSSTGYFLTTPFTQLGAIFTTGQTEVDSNQQQLPELANTGATGSLDDQKYYSSPTLSSQIGTGTRTWTLQALTSDTAQFCIDDTDDLPGSLETEIDCYDMDAKGNVTAIEITFKANGQSITFK